MKIDLNKVARKIEVDNRIPLVTTTASPIIFSVSDLISTSRASIYREEKNVVDLYIMLLRYSSYKFFFFFFFNYILISENVPFHQDYQASLSQARLGSRKRLRSVINELESLKPEFDRQVDELNREDDELHRVGSDFPVVSYSSDSVEWPPVHRDPYSRPDVKKTSQPSSTYNNSLTSSSNRTPIDQQFQKLSFDFLPPNRATLSRHSFLGPNGLKSQWVAPSRIKMMVDGSDILRRLLPSFSVTQLKTPFSLWIVQPPAEKLSLKIMRTCTQPYQHVRIENMMHPNLSPNQVINSLVEKKLIGSKENAKNITEHVNHVGNSFISTADPRPGPALPSLEEKEGSSAYQHLHVVCCRYFLFNFFCNFHQSVSPVRIMEDFLRLARSNTKRNLETCGKNRVFHITTLIIPKQESTSDSFSHSDVHCQTLNEEEIFEVQDRLFLFPLGWIHTHPTETCFMSSVDLHTHYSYQIMLPEAVAIVMARTDETTPHGIFHLSDPSGVSVIRNCQQRGFHPHEESENGNPIYEHCSHVFLNAKLKYEVLELR
ncbi:unnamed protein product [Brassica rapa subsp. trilocularis]